MLPSRGFLAGGASGSGSVFKVKETDFGCTVVLELAVDFGGVRGEDEPVLILAGKTGFAGSTLSSSFFCFFIAGEGSSGGALDLDASC